MACQPARTFNLYPIVKHSNVHIVRDSVIPMNERIGYNLVERLLGIRDRSKPLIAKLSDRLDEFRRQLHSVADLVIQRPLNRCRLTVKRLSPTLRIGGLVAVEFNRRSLWKLGLRQIRIQKEPCHRWLARNNHTLHLHPPIGLRKRECFKHELDRCFRVRNRVQWRIYRLRFEGGNSFIAFQLVNLCSRFQTLRCRASPHVDTPVTSFSDGTRPKHDDVEHDARL